MRTRGNWEFVICGEINSVGVICTPTEREIFEERQIRNDGCDLAHCFGSDREDNARLMAAAPDLLAAIDCILRYGLTEKTRKKARNAIRKAREATIIKG